MEMLNMVSDAAVPCSEAISMAIEGIKEIVVAANDVLIQKESFKGLAEHLDRIVPILRVLNMQAHCHSQSLYNALQILNQEIKAAREVMEECSKRSKLYLLMNCRRVVNHLEKTSTEISNALSRLPLISLDLSSGIIEDIGSLCEEMKRVEFKAAIAEEEILDRIDIGIQDGKMDRTSANNLLVLIADAVGISQEKSSQKRIIEEFKKEIENVRLRKHQAEDVQMDQIIALLETADAASSPQEKETRYLKKRNSLGSQPLEPLQSFYCPITMEVMVDPVETSSGQTFERSAIEKWFAGGNKTCPLTWISLDTAFLRPNKTLRQSIEEWKDRNTIIRIAYMKQKLDSEEEEEVQQYLDELQDLCKERYQHREWVVLENYIPTLVKLLKSRNRDIRHRVLSILCILAKDRDDAKERIAEVDDAIEHIVRSLGRRIEGKLAVAVLLELSKFNLARESIGNEKGCIVLLVAMTTNDDHEAARDARILLEKLSFSDENVIQMANANYFEYFVQRLLSGPVDVKMKMAKALAEMELTDRNKDSLFESGVSTILLSLITSGDNHTKTAAAKALKNLSTVPKNGLMMIREGAVGPLLDQLVHHSSSSQGLREELAATIMHMAASTQCQESSQDQIGMLESDDEIFKLFSLVDLTVHGVQEIILQAFNSLCSSPSAQCIKSKLLKCSAFEVLSRKFELENPKLRANALRLFCFLVEDVNRAVILEHTSKKFIENLLRVIQVSDNGEEIASALGIIANLPEEPQIIQWLTDAGAIAIILSFLQSEKWYSPNKNQVIENAVGAICPFTAPENLELQKRTAEAGVIPILVELLESGSNLTKHRAAASLARFATSSPRLSRPIPKHKGIFLCFAPPPEHGCPVHGGICTIKSSFCLVEADAVRPLVRVLNGSDPEACGASLDALLTFLDDENLQNGTKLLSDANAIQPIIKLLSSTSLTLQEKAVQGLEKIFQLAEYKKQYGPSAQMPLVELTQQGNRNMKSQAAKVLAQLEVLGLQSSFF